MMVTPGVTGGGFGGRGEWRSGIGGAGRASHGIAGPGEFGCGLADGRGDDDIDFCLFGDDFSKLGCDDGGNERADRTAEFIARDADGSGGEKDERRCL